MSTLHLSAKRLVLGLGSYIIAAACLYWVFHDVPLQALLQSMAGINWWWVGVAIGLDLLTYVVAAMEWGLLLRPMGGLPLLRTTQAYYAGLFANDVVPFHFGYFVRGYLVARWMRVSLFSVIPSFLVERLCDGFWMALGLGLVAILIPLPKMFMRAGDSLGVVILVGIALFVIIIFYPRKGAAAGGTGREHQWRIVRRILGFVGQLTSGVRDIQKSHLLPQVLGLSLLKLGMQSLAFFAMMWAYGFRLSIWAGAGVFLISRLGITIPSTPAAIGVYQVVTVAALSLFGMAKPAAGGFSLVSFVFLTAPLWIVGFFALAQSGMNLGQIRKGVEEWKQRKDE